MIIKIDPENQALYDPEELPVATPEVYLYSEIRKRMIEDIEKQSISLNSAEHYFNVNKHTIYDILQKKAEIGNPKTFLTLAIAYNIDIDNFDYPIYQKNHKKYPDISKIKIDKIVKALNLGLKRNLSYRVHLYGSPYRIAKNTYMEERRIEQFLTGKTKTFNMTNIIRIAVYIKKNLKRIIYDGFVYHARFKPFNGQLTSEATSGATDE